MRYFTFLLVTAVVFFSCKPSSKEAVEYSNTIGIEKEKISKKYDKLLDSYHEYIPQEMDTAYSQMKSQIEQSLTIVNKLQDFAGDSTYKVGAINLCKVYSSVIDNEHKRIIELLKLPEDEYQDKEINEYKELIEASSIKIETATKKLHDIQAEFLKPYKNVSLVKPE